MLKVMRSIAPVLLTLIASLAISRTELLYQLNREFT